MSSRRAPRPASTAAVARAYLRLLAGAPNTFGVALLLLVYASVGSDAGREPFENTEALAGLMFFLPVLHWQGAREAALLHAGLPIARARDALIRVACGALVTVAVCAVPVFVAAIREAHRHGAPPAHAAAAAALALLAGTYLYLEFSAVMLHRAHPPRAFAVAAGLIGLGRAVPADTGIPDGILQIAYLLAILPASAALTGWEPRFRLPRRDRRLPPGLDPGGSASALPARPALPRRPAGAWTRTVAAVRLSRRQVAWAVPGAMGLAWLWGSGVVGASGAPPSESLLAMSMLLLGPAWLWPFLIWSDASRSRRAHEDTLPCGRLAMRTAEVCGGAAWLAVCLLAVTACAWWSARAGGVMPPPDAATWLVLAAIAFGAYLWGTFPVLLLDRFSDGLVMVARALTLPTVVVMSLTVLAGTAAAGDLRVSFPLLLQWLALPAALVALMAAASGGRGPPSHPAADDQRPGRRHAAGLDPSSPLT
ncbi:MAG TPA: hypothetical protein VFQ45_00155 [Longimicrobium sp.]|nr:hypothetical protein [Longimicrobium sp.]